MVSMTPRSQICCIYILKVFLHLKKNMSQNVHIFNLKSKILGQTIVIYIEVQGFDDISWQFLNVKRNCTDTEESDSTVSLTSVEFFLNTVESELFCF